MKQKLQKIKYRMGGAAYNVIKHCDSDTQTKYSNLAYSLMLSTLLAAIGGYDIAHQFTTEMAFCIAVAILWGLAVFSFDFFLINGGSVKNGLFKYIRIPVGLANVFITITALFVLLNQPTIDSNIRLENSNKIRKCDSLYLISKENRYARIEEMKKNSEAYHQKNCVPEALNGHPGPRFDVKHALCITTNAEIKKETAILDSTETAYYTAYHNEKEALQSINNKDFFAKAKLLPGILSSNKFILILAVCLFIFLGYVELQSILMKWSINPDDEYHINLRTYNANRKGILASMLENEICKERDTILLNKMIFDEEVAKKKFEADMEAADSQALRELEIKCKLEILREKGYDHTADELEKLLNQFLNRSSSSQVDAADIFRMTQSMAQQVAQIQQESTIENLAENIFNWVLTNIDYDTSHSKEHYRTARATYNERKGLCGELSVLYISFLRAVNIECNFCEVTKDEAGNEVEHACIIIKHSDGKLQLSDLAYKAFTISHSVYRELTDTELKSKYDNWNQ